MRLLVGVFWLFIGVFALLALAVGYLLQSVVNGCVYGLQSFVEFLACHTEDFE